MKAYVFQAALLCEDCGLAMTAQLLNNGATDTGDSDDFPQGPYENGGGEADCPQHCDHCHTFLENPLTGDGRGYVYAALTDNDGNPEVLTQWAEFYGITGELTQGH